MTYKLLVDGSAAAYIIEEWWHRGYDFDMNVRRIKSKRMVMIEVSDVAYAAHLQQYYNAEVYNQE